MVDPDGEGEFAAAMNAAAANGTVDWRDLWEVAMRAAERP